MTETPPVVPEWQIHLVDDDAAFRRSLVFLLESMGWPVQAHASAADYLDAGLPALEQTGCLLVDVRSDAEREWVGFVPGATAVAWKQWPGMTLNAQFDDAIRQAAAGGVKLVLLCRSGVRSIAAAKRATELGLAAYNIPEGFEGDPDADAHRGRKGGWRFHGLAWRQN